jgi:hypothetical protein
MQSPATSSDSTIIANGKTLPDITLGSLGSSFRSEEEEEQRAHQKEDGWSGPARGGLALPGLPSLVFGSLKPVADR